MHLLAYNLIRRVMLLAAVGKQVPPGKSASSNTAKPEQLLTVASPLHAVGRRLHDALQPQQSCGAPSRQPSRPL